MASPSPRATPATDPKHAGAVARSYGRRTVMDAFAPLSAASMPPWQRPALSPGVHRIPGSSMSHGHRHARAVTANV